MIFDVPALIEFADVVEEHDVAHEMLDDWNNFTRRSHGIVDWEAIGEGICLEACSKFHIVRGICCRPAPV